MSAGVAGPRAVTYGRGYAWSLVWAFTLLSVAFNAAHAVLAADGSVVVRSLAAFMAIIAPVALLLATHLVIALIRGWTARRRWLAALRAFSAMTAMLVGLFAFILSFAALRDLAVRLSVPAGQAWMVPAVIDAMIIIATLAVVVAEAEMALDRETTAESDTAMSTPTVPAHPARSTEQSDELGRPTPADRPDTSVGLVDQYPDAQLDEPDELNPTDMVDWPRPTSNEQLDELDEWNSVDAVDRGRPEASSDSDGSSELSVVVS